MSELGVQGGMLWKILSIEEEILNIILKDLDAISLKNFELTSFFYRTFIQRAFIWKKKFEKDHPNYFKGVKYNDIARRMRDYSHLDNHLKFKILCLRINHLHKNWETRSFQNKNINLKKVFNQETIKTLDTNMILTVKNSYVGLNDSHEICEHLYDISKCEKSENFQKPSSLHILDAHIFEDYMVLFGIEDNFVIKLFSNISGELLKQTDNVREKGITKWSKIKIYPDVIIAIESNFWGLESNTDEDCDSVHIFDYKNDESENIQHIRKIVLDLPPCNYLTMFTFDDAYLIGNQENNDIVELWDLKNLSMLEDQMKAPVIWRIGVSERNTSAIFCHPFAYIGKSNGRCDIWNVTTNTRIRSLEHDTTGANIFLTIKKVLVLDQFILTLTQRGKIYAWDKKKCLADQDSERCVPVWKCSSSMSGNVIYDLYADTTKLVCLESNTKEAAQWLVVKDMWHCQSAPREISNKKRFHGPQKFDKRRKFAFDL